MLREIYWSRSDFLNFRNDFLERARAAGVLDRTGGARVLCMGSAAVLLTTDESQEESDTDTESTLPVDGDGCGFPQQAGEAADAINQDRSPTQEGTCDDGPDVSSDSNKSTSVLSGVGDNRDNVAAESADATGPACGSDGGFSGGDGAAPAAAVVRDARVIRPDGEGASGERRVAAEASADATDAGTGPSYGHDASRFDLSGGPPSGQKSDREQRGAVAPVVDSPDDVVPRCSIIDQSGLSGPRRVTARGRSEPRSSEGPFLPSCGGGGGGGAGAGTVGWLHILMPWEWNRPCSTLMESNG